MVPNHIELNVAIFAFRLLNRDARKVNGFFKPVCYVSQMFDFAGKNRSIPAFVPPAAFALDAPGSISPCFTFSVIYSTILWVRRTNAA